VMAAPKTQPSRRSSPLIANIIALDVNIHLSMSTGAIINHGVSGYACTGIPGDFDDQTQGTPWRPDFNDPSVSYNSAQNHMGVFMSQFNEPWRAGDLQDANMSAQPYRTPIVGPWQAPPPPPIPRSTICKVDFPEHTLHTHPQHLPSSRIHVDPVVRQVNRQNNEFERGTFTGTHAPVFPSGLISVLPNTVNFQGSTASTGVHPGVDVAGQQTTGNTSKPDQPVGQQPSQKLPNGVAVGSLQDSEPPPLWASAPPPDPQVLPGEGTQPLHSTNPPWW
jgi:hypothetical protein